MAPGPPGDGAYSIRHSLQGALEDFVRASGFSCIHLEGLIREFVGMLAAYREEDTPLYPEVFVFASQDGLTALAPSGARLAVGSAPLSADAASRILKHCAALARHGWAIFAVKDGEVIRYGLFRSLRHSYATTAEESMKDIGKDSPVISIRNKGHLVVELHSTVDSRFTVALRTTPAQPSPLETHVARFADVAGGQQARVPGFNPYLRRLLAGILQDCHGTLLAVVENNPDAARDPTLADGVWPMPSIPLAELHANAVETGSADALATLQAMESLLAGMVNSDGLVLFGTDGAILAFRVFLKPDENERNAIPDAGGGRRRAFELMRLRLGGIFKAVLFRSQDGETMCERAN